MNTHDITAAFPCNAMGEVVPLRVMVKTSTVGDWKDLAYVRVMFLGDEPVLALTPDWYGDQ